MCRGPSGELKKKKKISVFSHRLRGPQGDDHTLFRDRAGATLGRSQTDLRAAALEGIERIHGRNAGAATALQLPYCHLLWPLSVYAWAF